MTRFLPLLCLLLPVAAGAASGSWIAEGPGVTLEQGGMSDSSAALLPPNTLPGGNARIETVSWRYRLLSAEPAGLQVHLCSLNRCIPLTSASGTSHALAGEAADGPLRFVYCVQTRGPLNPPLRAIANQVIVNYQ